MAISISTFHPHDLLFSSQSHPKAKPFLSYPSSISFSIPNLNAISPILPICQASRSQPGPVKNRSSSSSISSSSASASKKKKKRRSKSGGGGGVADGLRDFNLKDVEIVKCDGSAGGGGGGDVDKEDSVGSTSVARSLSSHTTTPLPKPPAGFVVDETGRVLMVSNKRIATIVDSTNNYPLECIIRRVFKSSLGNECMLLCPVDTPIQILKSTNINGWSVVSDEEVEAILPATAFALAKIHMHLVHSGFCYTARGGFCYSEDDILDFRTDDGQDADSLGLPNEGVEITSFHLDGALYMLYTPCDPLLFVAVKDQNGLLQIADDDLLDDPAIATAIDEETEFNALVEEEAALLESHLDNR